MSSDLSLSGSALVPFTRPVLLLLLLLRLLLLPCEKRKRLVYVGVCVRTSSDWQDSEGTRAGL